MYSREELVNLLKNGIVRVVFTKKDGTERVMPSTLNEAYIPSREVSLAASRNSRNYSDENIRVYDTELQAWRAFRVDSVKEVKVNV